MTDFNTIYQQTNQKLTSLQNEIAQLEKQIQSNNQKFDNEIDDVKAKANLKAEQTEVTAIDYVSKINLDVSKINSNSVFTVLKSLLKI
jgi:ABC-type Fe2+-enterobactin transport system substrate-binding protein